MTKNFDNKAKTFRWLFYLSIIPRICQFGIPVKLECQVIL